MADHAARWAEVLGAVGTPDGTPDGDVAVRLADGAAVLVTFDPADDPDDGPTRAGVTIDWSLLPGRPAAGVTPVVVAWTDGGGVVQLAPEVPDPGADAPGARTLGGPELRLDVRPGDVAAWVARLVALPRRRVLARPEQVVWLGDLDGSGHAVLRRLVTAPGRLVEHAVGTVEVERLCPPDAWAGSGLRTRRVGVERVYTGSAHLTCELFAVEPRPGSDGVDQAPGDVRRMADAWGDRQGSAPATWERDDHGVRRWLTLHPTLDTCPVRVQVPELLGASCWLERGEAVAAQAARADDERRPRARRWWRRS